jgi:polysaccharide export outer membrane protein
MIPTKKLLPVLLTALLTVACSPVKNVSYLQDLRPGESIQVQKTHYLTLQPGDRLRITVFSRDRELTDLFNLNDRTGGSSSSDGSERHPYTVRTDGTVEIPTLGPIRVQGLTRQQVADQIKYELLSSKLLLDPTVIVEYADLAFTVLGEVGHPGRIQIPTDQVTLLEALALAGDLTIFGRRENVLVLRTEKGIQTSYYVDLTSARSLYESPVYYLRQNDIVYVEPNPKKADQSDQNASTLRSLGFWMTIPSYIVTLVVLFTRNK